MGKKSLDPVNTRDITAYDLGNNDRLQELYHEFVKRKYVKNSEMTFIHFVSYAVKALQEDKFGTPGKMFYSLIKKDEQRITDDQEQEALKRFPAEERYQALSGISTTSDTYVNHLTGRHIGFLPAVTAQCFFPQRQLDRGVNEWKITHGKASLLIESGKIAKRDSVGNFRQCNVPYGSLARMIFTYIVGQSVRTNSPMIDMGGSLRKFLKKLGYSMSGRRGRLVTNAVEDMAAASFVLGTWEDDRVNSHYGRMIDTVSFWIEPDNHDSMLSFWQPEIVLSNAFYSQIQGHNIPIDLDHLQQLTRSPRRMDLYVWLVYRTPRVSSPKISIPLRALRPIFAPDIQNMRLFKQRIKQDLKAIHEIYSGFKVEIEGDMLVLRKSPPPIPFKKSISIDIEL